MLECLSHNNLSHQKQCAIYIRDLPAAQESSWVNLVQSQRKALLNRLPKRGTTYVVLIICPWLVQKYLCNFKTNTCDILIKFQGQGLNFKVKKQSVPKMRQ